MKKVSRLICLGIMLWIGRIAVAQQNTILSDRIKTLMVRVGDDLKASPIIRQGENEYVEISFDELSHDYRRLAYKVEHCEANWQVSDQLIESDFLDGFGDDLLIPSVEQSMNTTVLYTHYAFRIPNAEVTLRLSGNYRVTIYDKDDDEATPLAYAYFSLAEQQAIPAMTVSTNTDVDWNNQHQQVSMSVNFSKVNNVNNPARQFKICVLQNNRWDSAVNPAATSVLPSSLLWQHCPELVFPAGNEYRKVEMLNVNVPTMGVDHIRRINPYYHFFLYTDTPRRNYVYDEDQDGAYVIRSTGSNVSSESDYIMVHFQLKMPEQKDGRIVIDGRWRSRDTDPDAYIMRYDAVTQSYVANLLMKQGYYNYMYLFEPNNGGEHGALSAGPVEGNYYQTENKYTAYVYFREPGGRTDRLLGFADVYYRP